MKHAGLVIGISLGLGGLLFLIGWLAAGPWAGLVVGAAVALCSILVSGRAYLRATRQMKALCAELAAEQVQYADVASLLDGRRETTGALLVTKRRVVFAAPLPKKQQLRLDFPLQGIALAKNIRGYFRMAALGREYRFKVFRCDALVAAIHGGIDALPQSGRVDTHVNMLEE